MEISHYFRSCLSLPLEGKGDRVAVEEVPTRASDLFFPVHRFEQESHRKPDRCASRGAGEGIVSVESRCPRL